MNYDKEYFVKLLEKLVLPLKQHYSPKGANLYLGHTAPHMRIALSLWRDFQEFSGDLFPCGQAAEILTASQKYTPPA